MTDPWDTQEITQLLARICHAVDADPEAFAHSFTSDAIIEVGEVVRRGRDEIRALGTIGVQTPSRHMVVNVVVHVDGDDADAMSYFLTVGTDGEPRITATGVYQDRLTRVDDAWLVAQRRILPDNTPRWDV